MARSREKTRPPLSTRYPPSRGPSQCSQDATSSSSPARQPWRPRPGAGPFVHAGDKSGSEAPRSSATGEHRYECFHNWGEVPDTIRWHETHGVAIDKAGFIYIKHRAGIANP